MSGDQSSSHSGGVPSTPDLRLRIVRDYATQVYGKELAAAAWLGQPNEAVLGGVCIVSSACQTEEGFRQAMDELKRIERLRGDEDLHYRRPPLGDAAEGPNRAR